jgi:hypothetical protein
VEKGQTRAQKDTHTQRQKERKRHKAIHIPHQTYTHGKCRRCPDERRKLKNKQKQTKIKRKTAR